MSKIIFVFCLSVAVASAQVRPPVESFPPRPYIAPPNPIQRAQIAALAASNRVAQAAYRTELNALFAKCSIPTGNTYDAVCQRVAAISLLNCAITNGIELDGVGVSADTVADSAGDFIGRYVLGVTNSVSTNSLSRPRFFLRKKFPSPGGDGARAAWWRPFRPR